MSTPSSAGNAVMRKLLPLALLTGLGSGACAWLLKWLCGLLRQVAFKWTSISHFNWQLLLWPVVGVLLTYIISRYLFRRTVSDSCAHILKHLKLREFRLSSSIIWQCVSGCALTVGLGASAGTESPTAYAGAAIGSNVGKLFGCDRPTLRFLIACGAGAGIAGIFRAPIGGFFFVLEFLRIGLSSVSLLAIGISCLTAGLTTYALAGYEPDLTFPAPISPEPGALIGIILLGALIGGYCLWYDFTSRYTVKKLAAVGNPWVKALGSGLLLGLWVMLLPGLFGNGFNIITSLLACKPEEMFAFSSWSTEHFLLAFMLIGAAMLLVKGSLVALANYGGGVAGDFSPTLFVGCIAGWMFAYFANAEMGLSLPPATFACAGMAAAMAGILRAPLMAIFITVETTMAYSLLLPVSLAALAGYSVVTAARYMRYKRLQRKETVVAKS